MRDRNFDYLNGTIPPSPDCQLPEPVRPEGDAGIMVTETCPHCGIRFLLANCSTEVSPTGEEWIEAEAWWENCHQIEMSINRNQRYPHYEKYHQEPLGTFDTYGVDGFDFGIGPTEPNTFENCTWEDEGGQA